MLVQVSCLHGNVADFSYWFLVVKQPICVGSDDLLISIDTTISKKCEQIVELRSVHHKKTVVSSKHDQMTINLPHPYLVKWL